MLYVWLWLLMNKDKLIKTHVVVPRNLFFSVFSFYGDHDEAFFSFLLVLYIVLYFLLDLLTFVSYQEFSVAFTRYQTDTISKFAIIEGAKNFPEEGRYFL